MWSHNHAEALASVFNELNRSGIRWLVLRNYEGLPETNRSKDIDLGLDKKDIYLASKLITEALKKHDFSSVVVEDFQYVKCCTFFRKKNEEIISIKIDLLDGFAWRGAQLFNFDQLYASCVRYNNFYVPDTISDGLMLWMKPLLTGGFVKERYLEDIKQSIAKNPDQFREKIFHIFGSRFGKKIWPLMESGHIKKTISYHHTLAWTAWILAFIRKPQSTLVASVQHIYAEIKRRSNRKPASFIAVLGPDGVGKTTFINLLRQQLAEVLVRDIETVQIQHFRPHIIPNIKELLSGKNYDATQEEFHKPHRATPVNQLSSLVRLIYYWLDYIIGYWFINRRKCAQNTIIIFDRYFYDFIVDPYRSRINLPISIKRFFLLMTPEPDLVFFLNCEAALIYARKQELSFNEIERQLNEYQKLSIACPKRFTVLNAGLAPKISCSEALKRIISHLSVLI